MQRDLPPMSGLARVAWLALLIGFLGQLVLGHAIAFGFGGPLFAWHQDRVATALWGAAEYGAQTRAYRGWIQALLGGTLIAWAWGMLALVAIPLRRGERWAAWIVLVSTLHWFVVDTAISAAHGVGINVAFNVCGLISITVPLAVLVPWLREARGRAKEREKAG